MKRTRAAIKRYPLVFATLVVALVGGALALFGAGEVTPWIVGGYAIVIAAIEGYGMIRNLLRGHAGIDILAVTAITAAVLVGEYWAALIVVLMLTGGEALEDYAALRSKRELTALLSRAPQIAHRLNGEATTDVPVNEILVGETVLVRPGELVPVDAVLLDSSATFDESSLTGESIPAERVAGEIVPSGAVNGSTAVRLKSVATAEDSQYQLIVRLVAEAAGSKASVVRLADRYAVPFTLFSLSVAGLAWAFSGDPVRFAEVLVVATPCPLLIAAPVAFMAGMSRSAKAGIIVKGSSTLEQLSRIRTVAADKTGTLTQGTPELQRLAVHTDFAPDTMLQLAASAEVYSSHVLADSVVRAAKQRHLTLVEAKHAEELATNGVHATVGEHDVRVGKAAWIAEHSTGFENVSIEAGELAVHVAVDGKAVGAIIMRDQVRPSTAAALADLKKLGVDRIVMVTGDTQATADFIGAQLGITEVFAECTPADKVRIVREEQNRPVMMVGDGLNDAPVLAASDVGVAMGARGSTAASESADVVNLVDDFSRIPLAVKYGKDTVRIALQSIWLGIVISVVLMIVAAFGFIPAIVGAWLQEGVDRVAILGALRALGPRSERRQKTTQSAKAQAFSAPVA